MSMHAFAYERSAWHVDSTKLDKSSSTGAKAAVSITLPQGDEAAGAGSERALLN